MTVEERNDMTGIVVTKLHEIETGIEATDDMFHIVSREQPEPWIIK